MSYIKVSCVIPAYNEAKNISGVLSVVHNHPLVNEIIVVDDCSKDETKEVVKKFENIKLIIHEKNKGKSHSVVDGIKESGGEFIFLLDADLTGFTFEDITNLIEPIISGKADVSISLRGNTPWLWHALGIDWISGERVFAKKFIKPYLEEIKNLRPFGLEVFMNKQIIKNKLRIKVVLWKKVASPLKFKKTGFFKGLINEFFMRLDIIKTISFFGKYYQITKMYFLKVK